MADKNNTGAPGSSAERKGADEAELQARGAQDAAAGEVEQAGEDRRLRFGAVGLLEPFDSAVGAGVLSPWLGHFFLAKRSEDGMRSVR